MEVLRIVVLGEAAVGKSALTIRFVQDTWVDYYDPTIEDLYKKQAAVDGKPVFLEILDTAGTDQFRAMRDMYMKTGEGFILVYSITSSGTFNGIDDIHEQIKRSKDDKPVGLILVGNKCDLEDQRAISTTDGMAKASKFGCPFLEASAKTKTNIEEVFSIVIRDSLALRKPIRSTSSDHDRGHHWCTLL